MPDDSENPFAPPREVKAPPDARDEFRAAVRGDTRGRRLAGWFFMANAAISIVAFFVTQLPVGVLGISLDLFVGFLLFSGYGSALVLAIFRIGYALLSGPVAYSEELGPLLCAILYVEGLALLLIGKPGKRRIAVGVVSLAAYLALVAVPVAYQVIVRPKAIDDFRYP